MPAARAKNSNPKMKLGKTSDSPLTQLRPPAATTPGKLAIVSPFTGVVSKPDGTKSGGGSHGSDWADLRTFLFAHRPCLKVSPVEFHQWLNSEDIVTIGNLAEAFDEVDYHEDLRSAGLKGFKIKKFLAAVKQAAGIGENGKEV